MQASLCSVLPSLDPLSSTSSLKPYTFPWQREVLLFEVSPTMMPPNFQEQIQLSLF